MVGPRPPAPRGQGQTLRDKLTMDQPGRIINPELRTLNELIRAGQAFNQEREYRSSPNHRPLEQLDMYNIAQAYTERAPTMDRGIDDTEMADVMRGSGGLQNISDAGPRKDNIPITQIDSSKMPEEFAKRPKLKYLYLYGAGMLQGKQKRMVEKAMADGHMKLSADDWNVLQSYMPESVVKEFDPAKTQKLAMLPKEQQDPYLKGLVADAYRKKEVDVVMEGIRNSAIGVFGLIGGLAGSSVGPGGTVLGGGVGAAAGSGLTDLTEKGVLAVLDHIFPLTEGMGPNRSMAEIARRASGEGILDTVTGGMFTYAPFAKNWLKQKALGITPESMATKEAGRRIGVDMLPLQVGRPILGKYTNVLARVPFIGGPVRKRMIEQNAQISSFTDSLPGRISSKGMTEQDVGVYLDIKAQEAFETRMKDLGNRQKKIQQAAQKQGNFIPMDEVSGVAQKWLDHYEAADFTSADKRVIKLMQNVVEKAKSGKISLDKWDGDMMGAFRENIDRLEGGEGTKALLEMMEAARVDLSASGRVGLMQLGMDKAWEAGFRQYESVAAKKFMLMDRNRFKQGVIKLGTKNPDELVGLLIGGKSPAFVNQVRGIVGDEAMRDLGSKYLDRQIQASRSIGKGGAMRTDWDSFAKNLGLDNPKGSQYGVTKEMLRTSGVTMDMLKDLITVAKASTKEGIPDVSTYLARRLTIGGAASIGALLGAAALGSKSFGTSLAFTLLARHGSKIISNPENIRMATLALDANVDQAVRRTNLVRLYRLLYDTTDTVASAPEPIEPDTVHRSPPMPTE